MNKQTSDKLDERDQKIIKLVRSLARGISPILFLVMITMTIGQGGMDRLMTMTGKETISLMAILVMFFGMVWAYTHEIAAGILIILAYVVLAITLGKAIPGAEYPIFFFNGILYLYVGFMERRR